MFVYPYHLAFHGSNGNTLFSIVIRAVMEMLHERLHSFFSFLTNFATESS